MRRPEEVFHSLVDIAKVKTNKGFIVMLNVYLRK